MSDIRQLAIIELEKDPVPRAADAAVEQLKMLRSQLDLQKEESDGQSFPMAALLGLGHAAPTSALLSPSSFGVRATKRPKRSRVVSSARSESSGSDGPAPIKTRRFTCSSQ